MQRTAETDAKCHECVVEIDDVSFAYEHKQVIERLSFTVLQRDFVGLIGANGAGKSTLLKMIVGMLKPSAGEIRLFGTPLARFKDWEKIGYVPQKNQFNPMFPATVEEVVLSGLYGRKKMLSRLTDEDRRKCGDVLRAMGIEDLTKRRIGQLSGGQQQRVFLARSLINNPELLILDEPTIGVDAATQEAFFNLLVHMHTHHRIAIIMVSHDVAAMQAYLGKSPLFANGKLKIYVKHSHASEDCDAADLQHAVTGGGNGIGTVC
ncbi:MAG TPA: metal ABC transporter ATP-binding protein [Bacilli bacterium]